MKNRSLILSLLLPVILLSCALKAPSATSIHTFSGSFEELILKAKNENKMVLIDFWATWCGPCKKMDKETYSNPELINYINENYIFYKMDVDSFDGLEISEKYQVKEYPTLLVLKPDSKEHSRLKGFYMPYSLQENLKKIYNGI